MYGVGADDLLVENGVLVDGAAGVFEKDSVSLRELVQVPEQQVALCAGEAEPVSGYVGVGATFPGKTCALYVEGSLLERLVVRYAATLDQGRGLPGPAWARSG